MAGQVRSYVVLANGETVNVAVRFHAAGVGNAGRDFIVLTLSLSNGGDLTIQGSPESIAQLCRDLTVSFTEEMARVVAADTAKLEGVPA